MISSIGNSHRFCQRTHKRGFTFIEVMVTVMILSTGIVMIYKSFLISLDQQRYLQHRLYANNVLDRKIEEIQQKFKEERTPSLKPEELTENVFLHNKQVPFTISVLFQNIPDLENLSQMDISISWPERTHPVRLARSVYISY